MHVGGKEGGKEQGIGEEGDVCMWGGVDVGGKEDVWMRGGGKCVHVGRCEGHEREEESECGEEWMWGKGRVCMRGRCVHVGREDLSKQNEYIQSP